MIWLVEGYVIFKLKVLLYGLPSLEKKVKNEIKIKSGLIFLACLLVLYVIWSYFCIAILVAIAISITISLNISGVVSIALKVAFGLFG